MDNTKQAFELLVKVTGMVSLPRADHVAIQEALNIVETKLFPKEEKVDTTKKK